MNLIEGISLSNLCDYSFGDQASFICDLPNKFMEPANINNKKFLDKIFSINSEIISLFIDNIRLYKRNIKVNNQHDQKWIDYLMNENDLLNLCSFIKEKKFIIFTNLEDTPIDHYIEGKIPDNVLCIHAVNAIYNNNIIKPFPYGIQRKMGHSDNRMNILLSLMEENIDPKNLLYVNHNINTNPIERSGIYEIFDDKIWATTDKNKLDYNNFLLKILNHKFMISPIGNAIDCHRSWEILYMRRVPIMKKNIYLEKLFQDFPVLFVNEYSDINESLLNDNEDLFIKSQNLDLNKLNLDIIYNKIINDNH